jgi:hypothetical protein
MRAQITATAVLATLALAGTADARGTYQEGRLSYSVSGSYVATTTQQVPCGDNDPPTVLVEKVSFKSGRGVAFYHGDVNRTPFFGGPHEHGAKLSLTVSRTVTSPSPCQSPVKPDCGTHTLKGHVASQFESSLRAGRPVDLHVRIGSGRYSTTFKSPFSTCGVDLVGPFDGNVLNPPTGSGFDAQAKALGYPGVRGFWARKRRTLSGTARDKASGQTLVFHMKMKLSRKTTVSRRDLHP